MSQSQCSDKQCDSTTITNILVIEVFVMMLLPVLRPVCLTKWFGMVDSHGVQRFGSFKDPTELSISWKKSLNAQFRSWTYGTPRRKHTLALCFFFPSARYRNPLRGCCWLGPMQPSNSQIMELRLRQVLLQSKHMEGWNLLKPHESSSVFNSFVFFWGVAMAMECYKIIPSKWIKTIQVDRWCSLHNLPVSNFFGAFNVGVCTTIGPTISIWKIRYGLDDFLGLPWWGPTWRLWPGTHRKSCEEMSMWLTLGNTGHKPSPKSKFSKWFMDCINDPQMVGLCHWVYHTMLYWQQGKKIVDIAVALVV